MQSPLNNLSIKPEVEHRSVGLQLDIAMILERGEKHTVLIMERGETGDG